jgi:hypothetical protein
MERLVNFVKSHWIVACATASALVWIFQTFVTVTAMADKEKAMMAYVDEKHASIATKIDDISDTVKRIDERVYNMNKRLE